MKAKYKFRAHQEVVCIAAPDSEWFTWNGVVATIVSRSHEYYQVKVTKYVKGLSEYPDSLVISQQINDLIKDHGSFTFGFMEEDTSSWEVNSLTLDNPAGVPGKKQLAELNSFMKSL